VDLMLTGTSGGLQGTVGAPITFKGAGFPNQKPTILAYTDGPHYQECFNIPSGAAYIVIDNFQLKHQGTYTQAGILISSNVHDITITYCDMGPLTGTGIQAQDNTDIYNMVITYNEIHDTGQNTGDPGNGGYGIIFGGFTAEQNVYDLFIQDNYIHDSLGNEGDCIYFGYGVYSSQILDNVFVNCPSREATQSETYGLLIESNSHYTDASKVNIVARNFFYKTYLAGKTNLAIYSAPGVYIYNNLIVQANNGIAMRLESASSWSNTRVMHNTIYSCSDQFAFSSNGDIADDTYIISNNVFSVGSYTGSVYGYRWSGTGPAVVTTNYYDGQSYTELSEPSQMTPISGSTTSYFDEAGDTLPFDFIPQSTFVDTANAAYSLSYDFDDNPRPIGAGPDIGCYEALKPGVAQANHWIPAESFKTINGTTPPTTTPGPDDGGSGSSLAKYWKHLF